jgi:hypothetical protein
MRGHFRNVQGYRGPWLDGRQRRLMTQGDHRRQGNITVRACTPASYQFHTGRYIS